MMTVENSSAGPGIAIVHIGLDKTGTTSIQEFCRYKVELLREAGVHLARPLATEREAQLPAL
jgi:hypothetical protein